MDDFALRMEQDNLIENGMRVLKAVEDYSVGALKGPCAHYALLLGRCLKLRMWETDESRSPFLIECLRLANKIVGHILIILSLYM